MNGTNGDSVYLIKGRCRLIDRSEKQKPNIED